MQLISTVRLINRAIVKEGDDDRLLYWNKIINIAEDYGIALRGSTMGSFIRSPFIESLYIKDKRELYEVSRFARFLMDISFYLNMYNGVKPYTKMEISVKYIIQADNTTIKKQTQLGLWYDVEEKGIVIKALDANFTILRINSILQSSITDEDIKDAIAAKVIFVKSV